VDQRTLKAYKHSFSRSNSLTFPPPRRKASARHASSSYSFMWADARFTPARPPVRLPDTRSCATDEGKTNVHYPIIYCVKRSLVAHSIVRAAVVPNTSIAVDKLHIATTTMRTAIVITKFILLSLVLLLANAKDETEQDHGGLHFDKGTPTSSVIALNETTFQDAIKDPANPLWFLKFYAPWYVIQRFLFVL
jgi:hypothetical protein